MKNVMTILKNQTLVTLLLMLTIAFGVANSSHALADDKKRTRAEAVDIAKERSKDGRVLSVKKVVNDKGVASFDVKIISNGRVKVYSISEIPN